MNYANYAEFQKHVDALISHVERSERGSDEEKKLLEEIEVARLNWLTDIQNFLGVDASNYDGLSEALTDMFCSACGKHTQEADKTVCYAGGYHASACDRLADPNSTNPCHCEEDVYDGDCEFCEENCQRQDVCDEEGEHDCRLTGETYPRKEE